MVFSNLSEPNEYDRGDGNSKPMFGIQNLRQKAGRVEISGPCIQE